ncbi:MAG: hypothetical protein AAGD35_19290 [Actinomycetota bacterium]
MTYDDLYDQGDDWLPGLIDGEQVLWRGRASRRPIVVSWRDIIDIPIILLCFVVVPAVGLREIEPGEPIVARLFLGLFVVVGLYVAVARFPLNWLLRRRTDYVLTNRRALVHTGLIRRRLRTHWHAPGDAPRRSINHSSGVGTFVFSDTPRMGRRDINHDVYGGVHGVQFYRIADAVHVGYLLDSIIDELGRAHAPPPWPTDTGGLRQPQPGPLLGPGPPKHRPASPADAEPPALRSSSPFAAQPPPPGSRPPSPAPPAPSPYRPPPSEDPLDDRYHR